MRLNAGILLYHGAHIGKETLATIKDPSKIIATSSAAAAAAAAAVTTSSANTLAEGNVQRHPKGHAYLGASEHVHVQLSLAHGLTVQRLNSRGTYFAIIVATKIKIQRFDHRSDRLREPITLPTKNIVLKTQCNHSRDPNQTPLTSPISSSIEKQQTK